VLWRLALDKLEAGEVDWALPPGEAKMSVSHTFARQPGPGSDIAAGIAISDWWLNSTNGALFMCTSNARNAATWSGPMSLGFPTNSTKTYTAARDPTISDDASAGVRVGDQ
jgi:hypothetical protein